MPPGPKSSAASPGEVMPPAFPGFLIPVLLFLLFLFFLVVFFVVVDFGCL
jgi:hypothetical protein